MKLKLGLRLEFDHRQQRVILDYISDLHLISTRRPVGVHL